MLAHEERAKWRKQMEQGQIPSEVERSILLYKKMRLDPSWRSSRFVETLGEAALLWFENETKQQQ